MAPVAQRREMLDADIEAQRTVRRRVSRGHGDVDSYGDPPARRVG